MSDYINLGFIAAYTSVLTSAFLGNTGLEAIILSLVIGLIVGFYWYLKEK